MSAIKGTKDIQSIQKYGANCSGNTSAINIYIILDMLFYAKNRFVAKNFTLSKKDNEET